MNSPVVVVGSFVQDLTWRCADFPQAGETVIGHFVAGPGGKGSNQAVAAGRAGAAVTFIGAVGEDVFADAARKFHAEEGIAARFVAKSGHATGTAAILVNAAAQNEIVVALGANASLAPADIDPAVITGAKLVVCQHETNLATNAHVFRVARAAGVRTVLNPAPMRPDFDPGILALVDILIPNETEFVALINLLQGSTAFSEAALAALTEDELHALCRTLGVPTVIVTLGRRGCLVSAAADWCAIPALDDLRVIDTTGAGDAFVGGFAAGWVENHGDLVAAARFGTAVAGLSVTKLGTAPSMPRRAEVLARLAAG